MSGSTTVRQEKEGSINGVEGRFFNVIAWPNDPKLPERCRGKIANQQWKSEARPIAGYGKGAEMRVEIRHDDECRNGHETFAITATVTTQASKRRGDIEAGGCMHEDIAKVFPELAGLVKWHLCSTDGPMHYIANTVYLAGDRDYNGLLKGESRQIRNGKTGLPSWKLAEVDANGEEVELYNLDKYETSTEKPVCKYTLEWRPWCTVGEGKERQLDVARSAAIWPEATDEQLTLPKAELSKLLADRLPGLLAEFRATVEACGFIFSL